MHFGYVLLVAQLEFSVTCFHFLFCFGHDLMMGCPQEIQYSERSLLARSKDDLAFFGKAYQGLKESITPRAASTALTHHNESSMSRRE